MTPALENAPTAFSLNSLSSVKERVASGLISWKGPLFLVALRPLLFFTAQALLALGYFCFHRSGPWHEAGRWWNVYGTLVDIGCLIGMRSFTRKEGICLRDLLGPVRLRGGHDVFLGLGLFVLIFPFFLGGIVLAQKLLYGRWFLVGGTTRRAALRSRLEVPPFPPDAVSSGRIRNHADLPAHAPTGAADRCALVHGHHGRDHDSGSLRRPDRTLFPAPVSSKRL